MSLRVSRALKKELEKPFKLNTIGPVARKTLKRCPVTGARSPAETPVDFADGSGLVPLFRAPPKIHRAVVAPSPRHALRADVSSGELRFKD